MLGAKFQIDVGAEFQLFILECRGELEATNQVDENDLQRYHRIPVSCFGEFRNVRVCTSVKFKKPD